MKSILSFALMLASVSSFAETYIGQGKNTEFGTETCGIIVESTGPSVVIKMLALNQEIATVVNEGDEVNFNVQLSSTAKSTMEGKKIKGSISIKASGKMKNLKPVSYHLEITSNDPLMGSDKESIDCKF